MPSIGNLGRITVPTWAWRVAGGALAVLGILWISYCYGRSQYDRGRAHAELAHTDSVRKVITRSIDSAHTAMQSELDGLFHENEQLKDEARRSRISAASALGRAERAESALEHLPDSVRAVTPPEVRALIDSLSSSSAALRISVQDLAEKTVRLQAGKDSALAEAMRWRLLQERTRAALDTSAKEIRQLQQEKKPPRCGFRCGFVSGMLTVGAVVGTIVLVAH